MCMETKPKPYVFYGYIYKHIKNKTNKQVLEAYYKLLTLITKERGRGPGLEQAVRRDFGFTESFQRKCY